MTAGSLEALITVQLIYLIAALGHYLPLSMKQLDIGIAGYFAIGAYTSAYLTRPTRPSHCHKFAVRIAITSGYGRLRNSQVWFTQPRRSAIHL